MAFFEIPTSLVVEDELFPDLDGRHIYEHLKYFLSLPSEFPFPAPRLKFLEGRFVAVSGQKYAQIARELNVPSVRAIIDWGASIPTPSQLASFGIRAVSSEELKQEQDVKIVDEYHVYFFEGALTEGQQQSFRTDVAGFFERLRSRLVEPDQNRHIEVSFPFDARCAVFRVSVPVADGSWPESYLNACRRFSMQIKKISSFQGAVFPY
jgi:hypothetical protein